jgi:hypothetical protein
VFNPQGTVFELTPNAAKTQWTHTVLYSFCAQSGCADGADPFVGLTMDAAGNVYGTTRGGHWWSGAGRIWHGVCADPQRG